MLGSDYVERQIRMLAAAIARILGLRRAGLLDEAHDELAAAIASIGSIDPRLVEVAHPAMIAAQIGDPERVAAIARLLVERSDLELDRGRTAAAAATRRRALELWLEALLLGGRASDDDRGRIQALIAAVGEPDARYAPALEALRGGRSPRGAKPSP